MLSRLQLFESVRGMPTFMLNNGLLKLICQLIAITTDYTPLSRCGVLIVLHNHKPQTRSMRSMNN